MFHNWLEICRSGEWSDHIMTKIQNLTKIKFFYVDLTMTMNTVLVMRCTSRQITRVREMDNVSTLWKNQD